jgi:hypothetical protein
MADLIIGGDVCPTGRNQTFFQRGDAAALLNDLLPEFRQAGLASVNLECPLIERPSPIQKTGPCLGAPPDCAKGLKAMGVQLVNLANNHILDHGFIGLRTTVLALEKHGIAYVGAGQSLSEARRIVVREVEGIRIGILAMAEHEYNIASRHSPGANPLDIIDAVRNITENRGKYDYLLVLLHCGSEHYPYPNPKLQEICRFLVEQGATAVICQHSHCAGSMENYGEGLIVYGQGNLLFDMPSKLQSWKEGCLVRLHVDKADTCRPQLIPFCQTETGVGVRRMPPREEQEWSAALELRSKLLSDIEELETQWKTFCLKRKNYFLNTLHGHPGPFRRLASKLGLLHLLESRETQRRRLHMIRCESYREVLLTILASECDGAD